jgi:hypothetical protein
MRRLHAVPAAALPGTGIDLETQAVDVMSSNNDTLRSFDAGIAHLEAIGDAAHAPIPRVVPFEKGEAALPFRDSNQDTLEMMVTR